ncbi:hypothetical protein PSCICM_38110 [Pseudomonas cichorii]|uniref:Uncharacterized protein n=1 Tax=Pseudomonas cichorii TaxID=36746 RepID=A0ABQ1DGG8_PSECI|nr:hypothetical protein PSCICM_38110 [Pseudomonas cichorii]GFM90095.1 hypothetical protein PSCICP_00670 [Pseudomonas cichorii]
MKGGAKIYDLGRYCFAMIRAIETHKDFISLKQRKNQKKDPAKSRVKNRD